MPEVRAILGVFHSRVEVNRDRATAEVTPEHDVVSSHHPHRTKRRPHARRDTEQAVLPLLGGQRRRQRRRPEGAVHVVEQHQRRGFQGNSEDDLAKFRILARQGHAGGDPPCADGAHDIDKEVLAGSRGGGSRRDQGHRPLNGVAPGQR